MRASDRAAAVQLAREAIRNGADPKAVRARLSQLGMGGSDFDPSDAFSDPVSADLQGPREAFMLSQVGPGRPQFSSALAHGHDLLPDSIDANFPDQTALGDVANKPSAGGKAALVEAAFQPDDPPENPFTRMMAADERAFYEPPHAPPAHAPIARSVASAGQGRTPQQARLRSANEALLDDPRMLAFLDTVASAEVAQYDTMFGTHRRITDMRTHPGYAGARFQGRTQSAAGRYQIQLPNYRERVERMGPLDMSPASQDLMAADIVRRYGGLDALQANDLSSAVSNLSRQWASLPHRVNGTWRGSRFRHQRAIPIEVLTAFYNQVLRYYSAPGPIPPRMRQRIWVNLRRYVHN